MRYNLLMAKPTLHQQQLDRGKKFVGAYLEAMDVKRLDAIGYACNMNRAETLRHLIQSARIEVYPREAQISTAPLESHLTADP